MTLGFSHLLLITHTINMTKLVKICGIRTIEAANKAIESQSDLLGAILVPNRARSIDHEVALQISAKVQEIRKERNSQFQSVNDIVRYIETLQITDFNEYFIKISQLFIESGPFLVGVFRNQPLHEVFEIAQKLKLDIIQLHGSENVEEYLAYNEENNLRFGITKRFVIPQDIPTMETFFNSFIQNGKVKGNFILPLLDSEAGGEGKKIDWSLLNDLNGKFLLAGGLNPENLVETTQYKNIIGFDVSGGVEDANGQKDLDKIEKFVTNGKAL